MSVAATRSSSQGDPTSRAHKRLMSYERLREQASLKEQHRQLRRAALGAISGLVVLCLLLGIIAYGSTQKQRELLGTRLSERNELRAAQASLAEAESQIDTLVRGRIPGLRPVTFDEVLTIDEHYVRNLVFTLARTSEGVSYEYKVVLHNGSEVMALPDFAVHLFDRFGAEIGHARVASPDIQPARELALYPDEVRSYAAAVALPADRTPSYFRLQFH